MQCNVLIQIRKYSKFQHSVTGKRPIFFLKINNRGVGIRMSWVEKFRKINNSEGTTNQDSRVI